MSATAIEQLKAAGSARRQIPTTDDPPYFEGDELYVPPEAFGLFNQVRAAGEIVVTPT